MVMEIRFKRTGGFAALPGLSVEGTVSLGETTAEVTSGASGSPRYQRTLTGDEVERLRNAADPLRVSEAHTALASASESRKNAQPRDAYYYEIEVVTQEGKSLPALAFNSSAGQWDQVAPALGSIVRWIDKEAKAIREHRLAKP
jgi:hypothetical protein